VSASTQNQALSAILYLYRHVLKQEVPWLDDLVRAKRPQRLPVVLTRDEAGKILDQLNGTNWLMAALFYGADLRLLECLELRIKAGLWILSNTCSRWKGSERSNHAVAGCCPAGADATR